MLLLLSFDMLLLILKHRAVVPWRLIWSGNILYLLAEQFSTA